MKLLEQLENRKSVTTAQTLATKMDHGSIAHPHNSGKAAEHQALLDLIPTEGSNTVITHQAIASGNWFDSNIWEGGIVPTAGAIVHIPDNINITYKGSSDTPLFAVQVDGQLTFAAPNNTDTKIVVDTLITTSNSHFEIDADAATAGTVDIEIRPFDIEAHKAAGAPGWNSAAIAYYSDGAAVRDTGARTRAGATIGGDNAGILGRYGWDPLQLSLGVVTHGAVRINGKQKRSKSSIAATAMAGDNSIKLDASPSGWQVGDQIVITGTRYVGREAGTGESLGSQDEIRTITEINGKTISFDRSLNFSHSTPRTDLKAYAANLTRNVEFHSATDLAIEGVLEADDVGNIATTLGHVMFMHNEDVQVHNAAFDDLGRSNKNDVLDDFQRQGFDGLDADRRTNQNGEWVKTPANEITNQRGRYAVHIHRAGATEADSAAIIAGSVITGGPGWGFVSHDSRANFHDNITYGVLGAGFVAETGNETGTWARNIAINTYGADYNDTQFDPQSKYRYGQNSSDLTMILEKRGAWKNHDMGHFGNGFWFQGKLIDAVDNVSVNSGLDGYFFMFRAPDQINVDPNVLAEPLSVHSPHGIHPFAPGLNIFEGNESIADTRGLEMIGIGGGRTNDERSVIDTFTAWEIGDVGTGTQYYPGYTIKDSTFIASNSPRAKASNGVLFRQVQMDTVLADLEIMGFDRQYDLRKDWSNGTTNQQGFAPPYEVIEQALDNGESNPLPNGFAHVVINAGFTAAEASQSQFMGGSYHNSYDQILTDSDLHVGRFNIEFDDSSLRINLHNEDIPYGTLPEDPIRPTLQEGHVLMLKGVKTDSIGTIPINYHNNVLVWHKDAIQHRLETIGYYHMPNGSIGVILEELFSDRYTADKHIVKFVAELDPRWDLTGAVDRGNFKVANHPNVYVPKFLLGGSDPALIRIDAGGNGLLDTNGYFWNADYGFSGGSTSYKVQPVAATENDELHYGKRYGNTIAYDLAIASGTYDVVLHTMEPKSDAQVGSRVFAVSAEGEVQLPNVDIFNILGSDAAPNKAVTVTMTNVSVTDGNLDLDFSRVTGRPVTLSGIEVLPAAGTSQNLLPFAVADTVTVGENSFNNAVDVLANDTFGDGLASLTLIDNTSNNGGSLAVDDRGTPSPTDDQILYTPAIDFSGTDTFSYQITDVDGDIVTGDVMITVNPAPAGDALIRIDVGGDGFVDTNGHSWNADYGYQNGSTSYKVQSINNTNNPELHHGKRYGNTLAYDIAIANGTYDVVLHTMDPKSDAQAGSRVFDVFAEGALQLDDFDIFVALGSSAAPRTAVAVTIANVSVTDGSLDLDFSRVAGRPVTLSGIEILPGVV